MTYEEALELMKDHEYWAEISDIDEAADIAIFAIEKQIPKKPNDMMCCPSCKREVELQPIDTEEVTYCLHCGQALDWEDTL